MEMVYPVYVLDEEFADFMDLQLITDYNRSHYIYIKVFNRFIWHKTKNKNEKDLCRYCLQCFSCKKILKKPKKVCFQINGKQSVKLRNEAIKFQNYFK